MKLQHLTLHTHNLDEQHNFYTGTLGFKVIAYDDRAFTVQIGTSRLTLKQATDDAAHIHHLAFNVSPVQFGAAVYWLNERDMILPINGQNTLDFTSPEWDARAVYFEDANGNILEFTARNRLQDLPGDPYSFTPKHVHNISEIGLASDDVAGMVRAIQHALDIPLFSGDPNGTFCALGDDHGLFIVVQSGRAWLPTKNRLSGIYPVEIKIAGDNVLDPVPGHPYHIAGTPIPTPTGSSY